MAQENCLIIGATGDVGRGLVAQALVAGYGVVACARNAEKLAALYGGQSDDLSIVAGDLSSEAEAGKIWEAAIGARGRIDHVVVAVNAPNIQAALTQMGADDIRQVFEANLITHYCAAKAFLPKLPETGTFVGIGGGTADFIIPGMAHLSMVQAALRMMYKGFAKAYREGPFVRELMIISMVNGASKRDVAKPDWLTDMEIGQHVCAIMAAPEQFPGPILKLKSRDEVGRPPQEDK